MYSSPSAQNALPAPEPRPKRPWLGIAVIAFAVLLAIAIAVFGVAMEFWGNYDVHHTWFITGNTHKYDPIAYFSGIQKFAGSGMRLVRMTATHVRSDGTLDLFADYNPTVEYQFVRPAPAAPLPPVGAGRQAAIEPSYEHTTVLAYRPWADEWDYYRNLYRNYGMRKTVFEETYADPGVEQKIVDAPECPFAAFWKQAIAAGAPSDAVATIVYDKDGYTFDIPETNVHLSFDAKCGRK